MEKEELLSDLLNKMTEGLSSKILEGQLEVSDEK
jgi:hypothetical protein